jgi:hypothetical protein
MVPDPLPTVFLIISVLFSESGQFPKIPFLRQWLSEDAFNLGCWFIGQAGGLTPQLDSSTDGIISECEHVQR